jgi:hypothetical protein
MPAPRRRPDEGGTAHRRGPQDRHDRQDAPPARSGLTARTAVRKAAEQVVELIGRPPEGVTSVTRTREGWRVGIEVLETRRVPNSTDILAVYRVDLDDEGELISYERDQRYYRGRANKE